MNTPIRKVLLIHSQTPGGSFLHGVVNDGIEMRKFVKSPVGGAFQDHEIYELKNPTINQVRNKVGLLVADYLLIYFSGHGYTRIGGERMISLIDGNLCDLDLLNKSERQLVIIDACRTLERGAAMGGLKWPEEKWDCATGFSEAREWFNQCILQSPAGKIIVHATAHNKPAFETIQGDGGEFSIALLDSVYHLQNKTAQPGIIPVPGLIQYVSSILQYKGVDQQPEVFHYDGYQTVPFALVSPEFIYPKQVTAATFQVQQHNKEIVIGILALLVIAACVE